MHIEKPENGKICCEPCKIWIVYSEVNGSCCMSVGKVEIPVKFCPWCGKELPKQVVRFHIL